MARVVVFLVLGAVIVGMGQGIDGAPGVGWWLTARTLNAAGFMCIFYSGVLYERTEA